MSWSEIQSHTVHPVSHISQFFKPECKIRKKNSTTPIEIDTPKQTDILYCLKLQEKIPEIHLTANNEKKVNR